MDALNAMNELEMEKEEMDEMDEIGAPQKPTERPLAGKRVLITRAHQQAGALSQQFAAKGAEVISVPAIEIVPPQSFQPLDKALKIIHAYDWLVLTSVNGVTALMRRLDKQGMDSTILRHLRIAAIGPATKEAIEQLGLRVTVMPEEYVAESVVAALRNVVRGQRVLLVRAKVARDVIPKQLREAGAQLDVAEAYDIVLPVHSKKRLQEALDGPARPHVITFTSSSTVRNFMTLLGAGSPKERLEGIALASIGPVTSKTLAECGLWVDVEAKTFTMPGLVDAVSAYTFK